MADPSGDTGADNPTTQPGFQSTRTVSSHEGTSHAGQKWVWPVPEYPGFILYQLGTTEGPGACYLTKTRKGGCNGKGPRPHPQRVCHCPGSWGTGPPPREHSQGSVLMPVTHSDFHLWPQPPSPCNLLLIQRAPKSPICHGSCSSQPSSSR